MTPMMHRVAYLALVAAVILSCVQAGVADVIVYPWPAEMAKCDVYQVRSDSTPLPALKTAKGSICSFGLEGKAALLVVVKRQPKKVVVRPLSSGVVATIDGRGFRLTVPRPMNLSVEVDGDTEKPLFLFCNPKMAPVDRDDPKVKYYEGGKIHEAGEIFLKDGETLYLGEGAVVRAVVRAKSVKNVAVRGPGILDGSGRKHKINMLVLRETEEALLEDFILLNPLGWSIHLSGSKGIEMHNTKVIGWRANSDGLDIEYSSDVKVEGCFWRSNDDCIAVKAIYPPGVEGVPFEEMINPEFLGGHQVERRVGDSMGNIEISRCVLWNDSGGQGFEIGFELRVDEIRNIRFHDSDIIHVMGGGAFTIHNGDHARIKDVTIENIRVEDTERFVDFHVGLSIYSVDMPRQYQRSNPERKAPPRRPKHANNPWQWYVPTQEESPTYEAMRGSVDGVVFKDIQILKNPVKGSILNGYSEKRALSDIVFENVSIEGKRVTSAKQAKIGMNEYVRGLKFR